MADDTARSLLRNHGGGHAPVSYLELFFDLVYVFAITQVSHFLLHHIGWAGLAEAITLFLAVWWAWVYTTWASNWADPERVPVRLMLLAAMFGSLVLAVAIPTAFAAGGLLFVASYVAVQVGRTLFMAWAMRGNGGAGCRNMMRIAAWFAGSGALWIAGALQDDIGTRLGLWLLALLMEYLGPVAGFRTPGLGRSSPADWNISGGHMAERCALFVIIALGEGIIVTGASFAELPQSEARVWAFALAFLGSVLMWWLYFDVGAARGAQHIESHAEPGRVARNAYTYLHMPIVAGIVITAAADALMMEHPEGTASPALVLTQCGGLLVYLIGGGAFKRFGSRYGNFPLSHAVGCLLLAALMAWGWRAPPSALVLTGASVIVLAIVAVWEWGSYHGGWRERFMPQARSRR